MKLYYSRLGNIFVDIAVITSKLAQVDLELVRLSPEEANTKEYKLKCLTGKFPCLETQDGHIFESAAIARYIARLNPEQKLAGQNNFEAALIDQWIDYTHTAVFSSMYPVLKAVFGWGSIDSTQFNEAVKELKQAVTLLNVALQGKQYLVGERLTVADIFVGIGLTLAFQTTLDAGFRKAMPNVAAWIERIIKLPQVVAQMGNIKLAAKAVKPTLTEAPKKEQAKPQAKKETGKEEDDEDKPKKKEENPLDKLPPSPFNLYDFKTFFVNIPDKRGEGMKKFLEEYDREGYSVWFLDYDKYEGEGKVLYQTSNLLNGFL